MNNSSLKIRQIVWWILIVLIVVSLPYLWVLINTPVGQVFTETLVNPDDTSVYLSAIRQGQEGERLFHFQFSPEQIEPKFMYVLYLFIGHLSAWVGGDSLLWFHGFRLWFIVVALFGVFAWVRAVLPDDSRQQATAWFLIVFGSGFGWLVVILLRIKFYHIPELGRGEWGLIQPFMATPHFALGVASIVWFFTSILWAVRSGKAWYWLITAVLGLILGLVYPYMIPVLGLITGLYLIGFAWQAKQIPWKMWIAGGLALLPMIPLLSYYGYFAQQDPVWALTHVQDNTIPPPALWAILISLGFIAFFAIVGTWLWIKEKQDLLLPIWAATQLITIYLPLPYSGRFILGWTVPVGTLAAYGLEKSILPWLWNHGGIKLLSRISSTPYPTLRRLILILTLPSTFLVILFFIQIPLVKQEYPIFLPKADMKAVSWLDQNTMEADLILSNYQMGNYLPIHISSRVFLGHPFLTLDLNGKFADLSTFWHENTSTEWRETFLDEWDITFIYYGTYEQELTNSTVIPPGKLVYDVDGVKIYDVHKP